MTRLLVPALAGFLLLIPSPADAFNTNSKFWPAMPIPYYVNPADAPDFGGGLDALSAVEQACANWSEVLCADVSFQFLGATDAGWAADGQNTIFWISEGWDFGEATAGATLWITPSGELMEVDLALNAEFFEWKTGGGNGLQDDVIDPVSVLSHELGHWLGLAHSEDQYATMYGYQLPNAIQSTLDGDDQAGICTLYPSGTEGCESNDDCPDDHACTEIAGKNVCKHTHDPPGSFCSIDHLNCEDMCWISLYECSTLCVFTVQNLSEGYCSLTCESFHDCPPDFTCSDIPNMDLGVCEGDPAQYEDFLNPPEPPPEPAPEISPDTTNTPEPASYEIVEDPDAHAPDIPTDFQAEAPYPDPSPDSPTRVEPAQQPASSGGCSLASPSAATCLLLLALLALLAAARPAKQAQRP